MTVCLTETFISLFLISKRFHDNVSKAAGVGPMTARLARLRLPIFLWSIVFQFYYVPVILIIYKTVKHNNFIYFILLNRLVVSSL